LDFALVRTAEQNERTKDTALEAIYRVKSMHPLAYVEWFTPFGPIDAPTGMYSIKPSTRNHHPYGEIIEVNRIVRSCRLHPKFGCVKDPGWTAENVTE
ncbi:hypothetical protein BDQ12DRAFT_560879, partial [Crucibulum laeve]